MGDLNYRIDLPCEDVKQYIKEGNLNILLKHDQLQREKNKRATFDLDNGKVFEEADITFNPTYKYDPGIFTKIS